MLDFVAFYFKIIKYSFEIMNIQTELVYCHSSKCIQEYCSLKFVFGSKYYLLLGCPWQRKYLP